MPPPTSVPLAQALATAARAWRQLRAGVSLAEAIERALAGRMGEAGHPRLRAAVQDITTTAVRRLVLIDALIARLAERAPAAPVQALLAVTLGQWLARRYPPHTLVDQAVACAKAQAETAAAAKFVNALLRKAIDRSEALVSALEADDSVRFNLPRWWLQRLRAAYPAQWEAIARAGSVPPPLTLRVNTHRGSFGVDAYLQQLDAERIAARRVGAVAIELLEPRPVEQIAGFAQGAASVQDAGAQQAAPWLLAGLSGAGRRVLDACAAPGGKTAHLAELTADLDCAIDAIEVDAQRALRIGSNLERLGLRERVRVIIADAARAESWYDGRPYDRILLDAPCTASGIVRRHPDIPWLRRPVDVAQLATQQRRLLDALWPLLAPAGRLLYVVCSLFPEEGAEQSAAFLARHGDARPAPLAGTASHTALLLPSAVEAVEPAKPANNVVGASRPAAVAPLVHDGFWYALFEKSI